MILKLNDAGWEAVTGVTGEGAGILCQHFGHSGAGPIDVILNNDTEHSENLTLHHLEKAIFGLCDLLAQ